MKQILIFVLLIIFVIEIAQFANALSDDNANAETKKQKIESKPTSKVSKCMGTALCITGKIIKIVDGDTIYIKNQHIRLSLTNTPEKNQAGFSEAVSFTRTLCPVGSTITVDQDDKQPYDKYKRLVGNVFCGDKVLNAELLTNNHATILTKHCKHSEFSFESWAKKFGCF